jgi:elongation factor P--beta-lysine ligase
MTAPSSERLAKALEGAGLHDLAARARADEFHDYLSPHALPSIELDRALVAAGEAATIIRAAHHNGEWDATTEESEAWARSTEGKRTFDELLRSTRQRQRFERAEATRQQRRAAERAAKKEKK